MNPHLPMLRRRKAVPALSECSLPFTTEPFQVSYYLFIFSEVIVIFRYSI